MALYYLRFKYSRTVERNYIMELQRDIRPGTSENWATLRVVGEEIQLAAYNGEALCAAMLASQSV